MTPRPVSSPAAHDRLDLDEILRHAAGEREGGLLVSQTIPALVAEVRALRDENERLTASIEAVRAEHPEPTRHTWMDEDDARHAGLEYKPKELALSALPLPSMRSDRMTDLTDQQIVATLRVRAIEGRELPAHVISDMLESIPSLLARAQAAEADRDEWITRHNQEVAWAKTAVDKMSGHIQSIATERDALAAKLRAVEALMAVTITPSGGEGVVTVANLLAVLSADTTPEATEPKCCCDGAAYYSTEQNRTRQPFMINRNCPVHGGMRYEHGLSATPEATE